MRSKISEGFVRVPEQYVGLVKSMYRYSTLSIIWIVVCALMLTDCIRAVILDYSKLDTPRIICLVSMIIVLIVILINNVYSLIAPVIRFQTGDVYWCKADLLEVREFTCAFYVPESNSILNTKVCKQVLECAINDKDVTYYVVSGNGVSTYVVVV